MADAVTQGDKVIDRHTARAIRMFGVSADAVTPEMRRTAEAMNLVDYYSGGVRSLQSQGRAIRNYAPQAQISDMLGMGGDTSEVRHTPETLRYQGMQSGRWEGRNPAAHNIPRMDYREIEQRVMANMMEGEAAPPPGDTRAAQFQGVQIHVNPMLPPDAVYMLNGNQVVMGVDMAAAAESKTVAGRRTPEEAAALMFWLNKAGAIVKARVKVASLFSAAAAIRQWNGRVLILKVGKTADGGPHIKCYIKPRGEYPPMFSYRDLEYMQDVSDAELKAYKKLARPRKLIDLE